MNEPTERLDIITVVLEQWADLLQGGTAAEQEAAFAMRVLIVAIRNGYGAELEAHLNVLLDAWMERRLGVEVTP